MNLPPLTPGMPFIHGYPKKNQNGEPVFVKYPKQVTQKIINQSLKDGAKNARFLKVGYWVAVAAWHTGYLLIHTAMIFRSEESCHKACEEWNKQSFNPDEVKFIIDFSHKNK